MYSIIRLILSDCLSTMVIDFSKEEASFSFLRRMINLIRKNLIIKHASLSFFKHCNSHLVEEPVRR
jgi:hypothetical protein